MFSDSFPDLMEIFWSISCKKYKNYDKRFLNVCDWFFVSFSPTQLESRKHHIAAYSAKQVACLDQQKALLSELNTHQMAALNDHVTQTQGVLSSQTTFNKVSGVGQKYERDFFCQL